MRPCLLRCARRILQALATTSSIRASLAFRLQRSKPNAKKGREKIAKDNPTKNLGLTSC